MRNTIPTTAHLLPPEAELVFKGVLFDVYQWQQEMFDGSFSTFEMLKKPDTVEIIAIKDDKIVILDEEQPNHPPFYSIPGGRHDKADEFELEAAKRELAEETGLVFKTWKLLNVKQNQFHIDHFVYQFLATDFEKTVPTNLDAGEKIIVEFLDFDEVQKLMNNPKAKHLARDIFEKVTSLDELLALPEYDSES